MSLDEGESQKMVECPLINLGGSGERFLPVGMSYEEMRAQQELLYILRAIARERGLSVALEAAGALRRAMAEGRIVGSTYKAYVHMQVGCVIGHLAMALGWHGCLQDGGPAVPGWEQRGVYQSDLEALVRPVGYGMTPESNATLALLDSWVADWMGQQRALPGDDRRTSEKE